MYRSALRDKAGAISTTPFLANLRVADHSDEANTNFPESDLLGSEYFQAYPSTDRDLGSIAMDHRALRHHSFTSSPGKEQSAIQQ